MKKYYNITVLLMIVAFLPISSMLYGQNINRLYTGNVYVKTYTEVPLTRAQEISKLYDKTYIIPKNELQTIEQGNILYSSPIWHYEEDLNQYTTDNSIILYDLHIPLQTFIEVNELSSRIESIDSIAGTPVIYILSLQNITYEQIDSLCTAFTASSYCKIAEPNYITFGNRVDEITPTTNPYYTYQWGLNNPGGVDINAPEAWNISTGNNIKVAVIDCGFELQHPDLVDNIYSSYDCTNGMDGAQNGAYLYNSDSYGTQYAGIIAAVDNNIGVIGVAPESKLILLRRSLTLETIMVTQDAWNINAIRTAYQLGADVINISWHLPTTMPDTMTILNSVLAEAYTLGRTGKGCIITCSAGSYGYNYVNYPSMSPYTLSVGAINRHGVRCTTSNYGTYLDFVAPGDSIYTTQIIPYGSYVYSSGTSYANSMVAGIVALVLSVNPYLTNVEVTEILKSTAYKLQNYSFNTSTSLGDWNNEVGYGLVDAYAAVKEAKSRYIQGPDYVCDTAKYYLIHPSQPGETVLWTVNNGNYVYPHYSIIGADNQDTVYIKCERANPAIPVNPKSQDRQMLLGVQSISVTISNGTSETYTKEFREPTGAKPTVSVSNSAIIWRSGTSRTFTITNCVTAPDSVLTWEVKKTIVYTNGNPNVTTYSYYTGRTLTYIATVPLHAQTMLQFTVTNTLSECEPKSEVLSFAVIRSPFLSAYDGGNILDVTISEDESGETSQQTTEDRAPQTLELWHNIYGSMGTQQVRSDHEQMDITGLPHGVYVLLLKENGEVIAQTKVNIN